MATLAGQTIANSYEQLLHVDTDGGGDVANLVPVKDGDNGTTFALQLATTSVSVVGALANPGFIVKSTTEGSATSGAEIQLITDDNTTMESGDRLGAITFLGAEAGGGSALIEGAQIEAITDVQWAADDNGCELRFSITDGNAVSTEALRLAPGRTTSYNAMTTNAAITFSGAGANNHIFFYDSTSSASVFQITSAAYSGAGANIFKSINSTTVQVISNTGGVQLASGATSWTAISSDERLKQNWNLFENATDKINTLTKIGEYQKKDPDTNDFPTSTNLAGEEVSEDKKFYGLSANEVQKILPLSAIENEDGYLSLNYQDVFVLSLKAIQELSARIKVLEDA